MNYKVNNLRKLNGTWHATLDYWEGNCYCAHKSVEVTLQKDTRPNDNDVIKAASFP